MPPVTLNNGIELPPLGLGTYQIRPDHTAEAVGVAIGRGYRLIDTAALYLNETEVGEGIAHSGVARSDIFLQTKLWLSNYGYDQTLRAFETSRRKLDVDYVDLYLLHWPTPADFTSTLTSYRAAERLLSEGSVRAIGVCNFNPSHLSALLDHATVVPAVNQIELHPFFIQREVRAYNEHLGIVTQSWSPLGAVNVYTRANSGALAAPLEHPVVCSIAATHGKTPAQVILRWHIEHGLSAIPKSAREERIGENFDVFDFVLTAEEVDAIDGLDTGVRGGPAPETADVDLPPFEIPR